MLIQVGTAMSKIATVRSRPVWASLSRPVADSTNSRVAVLVDSSRAIRILCSHRLRRLERTCGHLDSTASLECSRAHAVSQSAILDDIRLLTVLMLAATGVRAWTWSN